MSSECESAIEKRELEEKVEYLSNLMEEKEKDWLEQFGELEAEIRKLNNQVEYYDEREEELMMQANDMETVIVELNEKNEKLREYKRKWKNKEWNAFLDKESPQAQEAEKESRKRHKIKK